ncbi:uncharacterized protein UV8b_01690 [Ustilaginoidea virens]|uniref:Uncharacterized protein n=1 Tax=Ustilaginoidea virens TaxID=1159556 RepID=A0A063BUE9_USTVR|nr:uncharacterized protein UV8b_01690 [Ustilaginoidea virens]QUC17449.1 hypothetical protein UV8b_01690 [Ustilaginoidea virens]GAO13681.1 hypothetical protein UVI_02017840 [Ustilaginoidea virens]
MASTPTGVPDPARTDAGSVDPADFDHPDDASEKDLSEIDPSAIKPRPLTPDPRAVAPETPATPRRVGLRETSSWLWAVVAARAKGLGRRHARPDVESQLEMPANAKQSVAAFLVLASLVLSVGAGTAVGLAKRDGGLGLVVSTAVLVVLLVLVKAAKVDA